MSEMTNKEIRQILAIMSMIILGTITAFYVITQMMSLLEFEAICLPFVGCIAWFFRKKEDD